MGDYFFVTQLENNYFLFSRDPFCNAPWLQKVKTMFFRLSLTQTHFYTHTHAHTLSLSAPIALSHTIKQVHTLIFSSGSVQIPVDKGGTRHSYM